MGNFKELSIEPGYSVHPHTWEMTEIIFPQQQHGWKSILSSYTQRAIDTVRNVTSPLWESVLCHITWWKRIKRGNNPWFDIVLPNDTHMEVKVGRIWNSAVIKKDQLTTLSEQDYYGIVYYRTKGNKPPSYYTSQDNKLSPVVNLKRNISIEAAFILPQPLMVYYYNNSNLVEGKIRTTWLKHKPMAFTRAMDLFDTEVKEFQKKVSNILYGRHEIQVFSVGYDI